MMPPMPPRPNSPAVAQPPPSGRGRACERGRGEATLPTVMLRHGMLIVALAATAGAGLVVDDEVFGRSLGGWKADKKRAAEYMISGSKYRTYKPEVTPTPEGGIFVSLRIDHRRGWMANPDTANLELSFKPDGTLESAQSSLGFQGRKITSEVIRGGTGAGAGPGRPGDRPGGQDQHRPGCRPLRQAAQREDRRARARHLPRGDPPQLQPAVRRRPR